MDIKQLIDYQNLGLTVWETVNSSERMEIHVLRADERYIFKSEQELREYVEEVRDEATNKVKQLKFSSKCMWKPYRGNLQGEPGYENKD